MAGGVPLETLVETTIVEADAVPVEATNCTWPLPVQETCTTLISGVPLMSRKRPNDGDSTNPGKEVKRQREADWKGLDPEKIANHSQENISEITKNETEESAGVRQRVETILDKYLADYNLEETTKTLQMTQFHQEEEKEGNENRGWRYEEESIENIQKFLDEWNLATPPELLT